ncbi:MAG: hypothetical protein QOI82_1583 [Actinomycetota bacterium]|jgi:acetyltransferase-like isoleucine patch superfamily enzyme|nr:hypothetical protein [Actinomycetota bacterium]
MAVSTATRVRQGVRRRRRLLVARMRYGWGVFGSGCDVGRGLRLLSEDGGQVRIGADCVLDRGLDIACHGSLSIGPRTIVGHHCTIAANESISIGRDCLIAELVSIRDHDHASDRLDIPIRDQGHVSAPVTIGDGVWLGSHVVVTRGVTIGEHTIVGAGAVVTSDLPAYVVAAGVPARVIKRRG